MSEERFDRLENAIAAMAENMNSMQQNIRVMQQDMNSMRQDMNSMQQNMNSMQHNMNALRDDVVSQRQRIDSIEGTIVVTIRDGFESMRNYLDDLNYDLAANERQIRRLNRRVSRLERKREDD
jgi:chromosome segregation ATPase